MRVNVIITYIHFNSNKDMQLMKLLKQHKHFSHQRKNFIYSKYDNYNYFFFKFEFSCQYSLATVYSMSPLVTTWLFYQGRNSGQLPKGQSSFAGPFVTPNHLKLNEKGQLEFCLFFFCCQSYEKHEKDIGVNSMYKITFKKLVIIIIYRGFGAYTDQILKSFVIISKRKRTYMQSI